MRRQIQKMEIFHKFRAQVHRAHAVFDVDVQQHRAHGQGGVEAGGLRALKQQLGDALGQLRGGAAVDRALFREQIAALGVGKIQGEIELVGRGLAVGEQNVAVESGSVALTTANSPVAASPS